MAVSWFGAAAPEVVDVRADCSSWCAGEIAGLRSFYAARRSVSRNAIARSPCATVRCIAKPCRQVAGARFGNARARLCAVVARRGAFEAHAAERQLRVR